MSDFDALRQRHTKRRKSVSVCFDQALLEELEEARRDRAAHKPTQEMLEDTERQMLDERVAELEQKARDATMKITFESLGRRRWRELIGEHPPTAEQREQFRSLDHNPETFPLVAMVESSVDPKLTVDQVEWILEDFSVGDVDRIWAACLEANVSASAPLGGIGSRLLGVKR